MTRPRPRPSRSRSSGAATALSISARRAELSPILSRQHPDSAGIPASGAGPPESESIQVPHFLLLGSSTGYAILLERAGAIVGPARWANAALCRASRRRLHHPGHAAHGREYQPRWRRPVNRGAKPGVYRYRHDGGRAVYSLGGLATMLAMGEMTKTTPVDAVQHAFDMAGQIRGEN